MDKCGNICITSKKLKISTFYENYKPTELRSLMSSKHREHEENYTKVHHKQVA